MARRGRHYANYIMNPSDVKEKEKIPVDSLGSSEVGCLFFAATDGISARTKREFREDASPPLSFRSCPDSFSLSRVFEPFEFKPRSYLLRASYLVISIMVGAFLSQARLHSFRPLARTRSSTCAERRRNDSNSSLIVPLDWTLSSRRQSVRINCRLPF